MEVYEIVVKLIGPIEPIGDSRVDENRLENMNKLQELINKLVCDIYDVSQTPHNGEHSIKKAVENSDAFMNGFKDY